MDDGAFRYKISEVTPHMPLVDGTGKPGQAIRSWCKRGLITGFRQHTKNAEYRLSARGVREAWILWAGHKGLDPDGAMSKKLREMIGPAAGSTDAAPSPAERPIVRIEVPPGVAVEVVYKTA